MSRKPVEDFDAELARLRQRIGSADGQTRRRGSADRRKAIEDAAAAPAGTSTATDQPARRPAPGLSLLNLVGNGPVAASAVVAGADAVDVAALTPAVQYVKAASADFAEACVSIEDFAYDEEAEERRKLEADMARIVQRGGPAADTPLPLFLNEPFVFQRDGDGVEGATAQSGLNPRFAPRAEPAPGSNNNNNDDDESVEWGGDTHTPSRASVAGSSNATSTVSAASVMRRQQQIDRQRATALTTRVNSGDLYAIPDIVSNTRRGPTSFAPGGSRKPLKGPVRSAPGATAPLQGLEATTAGALPPPPRIVHSARQVRYRDPAVVTHVSDGRIAFCQECHRVIVGHGRGRCPHCGAFADTTVEAADAAATTRGAVGTQAAPSAPGAPRYAPGSIEAIEAEERRLFQKAVAEWRSGSGGAAPPAAEDDATGGAAAAAEGDANVAACVASLRRATQHAGGGGLYFTHLWSSAFT